jgi:deoxyribose-phosphate aldolase
MSDRVRVDLARLVAFVVEEVIARTHGAAEGVPGLRGAASVGRRRGGASRLADATGGATTGVPRTAAEVARFIDHTLLRPDASRDDIDRLCREAVEHGFATVCVNPVWVRHCAARLEGSGVGVCAVAGFPLGATTPDVKAFEARRAIFDGATEVDMVINVGALKSGDLALVERDIRAVTEVCRHTRATSKVIIEAALLTDQEKVTACTIAKAAGAGFVKTSTGFGPGGASAGDVALMRRTVGPGVGVKAAGGIRDLATLQAMVAAGATRIGTSAGVAIVGEARGERGGGAGAGY